ncbi:MAG: hypothetical protein Q6363_003175, partial [Candidatus Njordarchaeota archaeon]
SYLLCYLEGETDLESVIKRINEINIRNIRLFYSPLIYFLFSLRSTDVERVYSLLSESLRLLLSRYFALIAPGLILSKMRFSGRVRDFIVSYCAIGYALQGNFDKAQVVIRNIRRVDARALALVGIAIIAYSTNNRDLSRELIKNVEKLARRERGRVRDYILNKLSFYWELTEEDVISDSTKIDIETTNDALKLLHRGLVKSYAELFRKLAELNKVNIINDLIREASLEDLAKDYIPALFIANLDEQAWEKTNMLIKRLEKKKILRAIFIAYIIRFVFIRQPEKGVQLLNQLWNTILEAIDFFVNDFTDFVYYPALVKRLSRALSLLYPIIMLSEHAEDLNKITSKIVQQGLILKSDIVSIGTILYYVIKGRHKEIINNLHIVPLNILEKAFSNLVMIFEYSKKMQKKKIMARIIEFFAELAENAVKENNTSLLWVLAISQMTEEPDIVEAMLSRTKNDIRLAIMLFNLERIDVLLEKYKTIIIEKSQELVKLPKIYIPTIARILLEKKEYKILEEIVEKYKHDEHLIKELVSTIENYSEETLREKARNSWKCKIDYKKFIEELLELQEYPITIP